MMKPKVALVKDGFLPAGSENKRGRLSGEAIARCKTLAAQGWAIEGYEVSKSTNSSKADTAPTVEKVKVAASGKEIADIGEPTRDEKSLAAYADGKKIGMREVCRCGASFTYCRCSEPMIRAGGDRMVVVYFRDRK